MQLLTPKKSKQTKIKKIKKAAGNIGNAAIAGAGTGSLVGLIARPNSGIVQRRGAFIGAGIGAGVTAAKSLMKPKKKKTM